MATSYGMFKCSINSQKSEFKTPVQFTLGGVLRDTQFKFRQIKQDYHQGFELWEIEQERKVDEVIIVAITSDNKTEYRRISEYIIPETLKAYYLRNDILLIEGSYIKRNYSYKLLKENFSEQIKIDQPVINIDELINYVERVEKVNIKRQSASADKVMLLGANVIEDMIFDQLIEEGGQIKSVKVSFIYDGTTHKLNISENGGLYLIGKYDSIDIQLEILRVFYQDYLKLNGLIK